MHPTITAPAQGMCESQRDARLAVDAGYWPLYRYQPGQVGNLGYCKKGPALPVLPLQGSEAAARDLGEGGELWAGTRCPHGNLEGIGRLMIGMHVLLH